PHRRTRRARASGARARRSQAKAAARASRGRRRARVRRGPHAPRRGRRRTDAHPSASRQGGGAVKLLGLHLLAYGPFTNVELDLKPAGVHVVYGKNEAGKSTALRAITGLLYGIARNTPDAHVHKMPDLRVGGRFRAPDGGSLYLVRRKGKDNTLLD